MALSEQGRGTAWHVSVNGMTWQGNGMGMAWAQHTMCESALNSTKLLQLCSMSCGQVISKQKQRYNGVQLFKH